MEKITSRKNQLISHMRKLGRDREYRTSHGEYICDGVKTLEEAIKWGAKINCLFTANKGYDVSCPQYEVSDELLEYVSPLKNSPGPVFSVSMNDVKIPEDLSRVFVLDTIQDPGNLGTILRSANAFSTDLLILTGDCADVYNPKTVRASMGAHFRQSFISLGYNELSGFLKEKSLDLYSAILTDDSIKVQDLPREKIVVAIGSEGRGVGAEIRAMSRGGVIIPMSPKCESLNAAIAASIIMWELFR